MKYEEPYERIQELFERHTGNSIKESAKLVFLTLYFHTSKLWQEVVAIDYMEMAYLKEF